MTTKEKIDPATAKLQNRKPFILLRGTFDGFDADGNRQIYEAGSSVHLTPKQFLAFQDKFTTPAVYEAQKKARQAQIAAANEAVESQADIDAEAKKASAEASVAATDSQAVAGAGKSKG